MRLWKLADVALTALVDAAQADAGPLAGSDAADLDRDEDDDEASRDASTAVGRAPAPLASFSYAGDADAATLNSIALAGLACFAWVKVQGQEKGRALGTWHGPWPWPEQRI